MFEEHCRCPGCGTCEGYNKLKYDPYKDSLERKLISIRELCNEILTKKLEDLEEDEIYYFAEMVKKESRF